MEQMIKDVALSFDINAEFKASCKGPKIANKDVDLDIKVLCRVSWPPTVVEHENLLLPAPMYSIQEKFTGWYTHKHANSKLTWSYSNGNVELLTNYTGTKRYSLIVNCFQAAILWLFNNSD